MIDIQKKRERNKLRKKFAENIGLSDTAISEICGIPLSTISSWKRSKCNDYRYKIYRWLKETDKSVLIDKMG